MKTYSYEESRWSGPMGFMFQINEQCHCCKSSKIIGFFESKELCEDYIEYRSKKVLQFESKTDSIKE